MSPRKVRGDVVVQVRGTKEREESRVQSWIDPTRAGAVGALAGVRDVDTM
jgi:hypothetical protein